MLGALFSPAGRSDPHVLLRGSPLPGCQYPFVRDVLRDPRFAAPMIPPSPDAAFQLLARWMLRLDGERHRRVRDAFGGLFTARRVERYRAIIAERAAALIDQAAATGTMEVIAEFAYPLPFTVIADVLGVPPGDRTWLGTAMETLNSGFARQRDIDRGAVHAANDAATQMLSYFAGLLDQRAAEPADDLLTVLAGRHADGEDRQDLIANCVFFMIAGHQSTTTLLTLGTYLLSTHPRALAALRDDPGRWPGAVEEMLRLICPVTFTAAIPRGDDGNPRGLLPGRAAAPALPRRRQPRSADVPRPRRLRHQPRAQPAPQLRRRGAFLPRRASGPAARRSRLRALFTRLPGLTASAPPDVTASVPIRQVDRFTVRWPVDYRDTRQVGPEEG